MFVEGDLADERLVQRVTEPVDLVDKSDLIGGSRHRSWRRDHATKTLIALRLTFGSKSWPPSKVQDGGTPTKPRGRDLVHPVGAGHTFSVRESRYPHLRLIFPTCWQPLRSLRDCSLLLRRTSPGSVPALTHTNRDSFVSPSNSPQWRTARLVAFGGREGAASGRGAHASLGTGRCQASGVAVAA